MIRIVGNLTALAHAPSGVAIDDLPLVSDPKTMIRGWMCAALCSRSTPTKSAPFALESADRLILMYFRDRGLSWAMLQFETLTARAPYTSAV